jgi:hypothetical protein
VVFLSGTTFAFIEAPALGWLSPVVLAMVLLGVAGLAVLLQHAAHNVHQQPDIRAGVSFAGRRSASASPGDASTVLRFISATARRSPCSAMSSPDWPVTGETGNLGLLGMAGQVTAARKGRARPRCGQRCTSTSASRCGRPGRSAQALSPVRGAMQSRATAKRPATGTCTPVHGRSGLRCSGRANHQDQVTPPHLPGGKPGGGPPPGGAFSQRIDMGERAWSAAKPTQPKGDPR